MIEFVFGYLFGIATVCVIYMLYYWLFLIDKEEWIYKKLGGVV